MPAATTHVEFGKDVLRILDQEQLSKITNLNMFYLGCQGPDLLLFSGGSFLPWSLRKIGDLMHDEKCDIAIQFFQQYSQTDCDLYSYYMGYLCHYALDTHAHPLINAIAKSMKQTTGIHQGEAHVYLEANIDVYMLNQRGRAIQSYDVFSLMKVDHSCKKKLAKMYQSMLESVYQKTIKYPTLYQAINDTLWFTHILKPNPWILPVTKQIERTLRMPKVFSAMVLVDKHDLTPINLDHHAYPLAYDDHQTIRASFPELYGKATLFAKKIMQSYHDDDYAYNFNGEPYSRSI